MTVSVTLAITTYNSGSYLHRTLASILDQIVPFDEIFVIDDCSNDNSEDVVNQFNTAFNQSVQFFRLSSNFGGPARSRNLALARSTCHIITYLDADDILLPSRCLNTKIFYLSNHFDAYVCSAQFFKVDSQTNRIVPKGFFPPHTGSPSLQLNDLINLSLLTPGSSLAFRTSTLKRYKFSENPEVIAGEDREVLFRLSIDSCRIIYSNNVDFLYNAGLIGKGLIVDDQHITSPERTLRLLSFYRENFGHLLPRKHYSHFDLSQLIALIRLHRYFDAFSFFNSLSIISILGLVRVLFLRVRIYFFS